MPMPDVLVLTDRRQVRRRDLAGVLRAAVAGGAGYVVLREKDLPRRERVLLARGMAAPARRQRLIVATDADLAVEIGAVGVHLASTDPWPVEEHLWVGDRRLVVGRSCHSEAELRDAASRGASYATLSPIFPTESKPDYGPPLGTGELARLCRLVPQLPVVALGGVVPGRVADCLEAGAAAVAVMGEAMRAEDPAQLVVALREEAREVRASRRRPGGGSGSEGPGSAANGPAARGQR